MVKIVVLTGTGISAESGIRTFRASGRLWEGHAVENVATPEGFARNPDLVRRFYNARRSQLLQPEIKPNAAHMALAELEKRDKDNFLLITQNVDNLHEQAGNSNLIHMHGELQKVRCTRTGQVMNWMHDVTEQDRCTCCRPPQILGPHIVWFSEMPLMMDEIYEALLHTDYFISIGTSGHVYPAAGFVQIANNAGAKTVELNLESSQAENLFQQKVYGPATQVVPNFVNGLLNSQ